MKKYGLMFVLLSLLPQCGLAEPATGQYLTEKAWGHLTIKSAQGKLTFVIDTLGANGHVCNLDGDIRNGQTVMSNADKANACVVKFVTKSEGVQVETNQAESCREFCGMRAGFEGVYLKPPQGCDDASRARTHKEFKTLYDKKTYPEAQAKLEPLLQNCGRLLSWLDAGWIRNDLALTQYKRGDSAGCLKTLEPLAKDAALSDDDVRNNYPPVDAESYLPIVKATRTNLRLCKAGAKTAH